MGAGAGAAAGSVPARPAKRVRKATGPTATERLAASLGVPPGIKIKGLRKLADCFKLKPGSHPGAVAMQQDRLRKMVEQKVREAEAELREKELKRALRQAKRAGREAQQAAREGKRAEKVAPGLAVKVARTAGKQVAADAAGMSAAGDSGAAGAAKLAGDACKESRAAAAAAAAAGSGKQTAAVEVGAVVEAVTIEERSGAALGQPAGGALERPGATEAAAISVSTSALALAASQGAEKPEEAEAVLSWTGEGGGLCRALL